MVVVSTDYHIAKGVGRALAYILDHAVSIRCGHQEVTTVIPGDNRQPWNNTCVQTAIPPTATR